MTEKKRKFNIIEQDLLEAYLRYYHHAANRVCFPPDSEGFDSDDDDETIRRSNLQGTAFENDSNWIAGHEFPALLTTVLEQPYLALPSTLGTTERRIIYEICVHVGLYHTGAGQKFFQDKDKDKDGTGDRARARHTVISVHPDGFDHVPHLEEPLHFPVSRCKPWFYRNDIVICPTPPRTNKGQAPVSSYNFSQHFLSRNRVRDSTRKHRGVIENLMAYPYQCLREDGVDTVETLSNPILDLDNTNTNKQTIVLIDTAKKMIQCAQDLSHDQITELAFDVEAYNASKYKQSTCLIQLCTNLKHQEYVIDVLAPGVWDQVSLLQPIFANPSVVKIGHGISGIDVPCLHRDFGIFIVNAFDTLEAATKLRLKKHLGLAKLCKYYDLDEGGRHAELKDIYQMCDWRERPLKEDQVEYGIMDVRFLVQLRRLLIRDILEFDAVPNLVTNDTCHAEGKHKNGDKHHNHTNSIISPLKEDRVEDFENEHEHSLMALAGSSDSMDIDNDENSNSDLGNDRMIRRDENLEDVDDNIVEGMLEAKNACDDSSAFFSAHDDIDGKSQSTLGSKVSELRYNQTLMDALKTSQQKCLALWTVKTEPAGKNDTLLHMKKRATRFSCDYDEGNTKGRRDRKLWTKEDDWLYKELIEWREDVAKKVGVVPSMMCSLDLLVKVAYRRPISLFSLKRLNYFLPKIFCEKDYSHHLEDLFSVVASAGGGTLVNADAVVRLYSERQMIKSKLGHLKEISQNEEDATVDTDTGTGTKSDATDSCSSSSHAQPLRAIVLDGGEGEDVSLLDANDVHVPHTGMFHKITILAAVVASIAIVGVGIMKKRK